MRKLRGRRRRRGRRGRGSSSNSSKSGGSDSDIDVGRSAVGVANAVRLDLLRCVDHRADVVKELDSRRKECALVFEVFGIVLTEQRRQVRDRVGRAVHLGTRDRARVLAKQVLKLGDAASRVSTRARLKRDALTRRRMVMARASRAPCPGGRTQSCRGPRTVATSASKGQWPSRHRDSERRTLLSRSRKNGQLALLSLMSEV